MNINKIHTSLTANILMISSSYPQGENDWKSVFIRQLLTSLADIKSLHMSYWGPPGILPDRVIYACLPNEAEWLSRLLKDGGLAHILRNKNLRRLIAPLKFLTLLHRGCSRHELVDIYHVNWLQNALSLPRDQKPAVISVLGSDLGLLKLPGMTILLRHVFKKRRCILVPNAGWMTDELNKHFGDIAQIITVPLGIDFNWFDLHHEKQQISSPNQWLIVARLTRKKLGPLFDWGEEVFSQGGEHELHMFGPMQEEIKIPEWVHYHGPTYPEELQKEWFPRATGLITTSQHDEGRPQVMLEAMAAGLPIIASDIPAHRDFITHKKTGWLVNSQEEFNAGIKWLAVTQNNQRIDEAAHNWVKNEVGTWSDCADRYFEVYRTLLGDIK